MAWTTPNSRSTGYVVTSTVYDNEIINNLLYLHGDSGTTTLVNSLTNGPTSTAAGGGGNAGVFLDTLGAVSVVRSSASVLLASSVLSDTQWRFSIDSNGATSWGAGGSSARDVTLSRPAAGVLALTQGTGLGYGTGTGGTATCAAGGSCTLNSPTGKVTGTAGITTGSTGTYTVSNSTVGAADVIVVNLNNGTAGLVYKVVVERVVAGSFTIQLDNQSGATITPSFNFAVIKGATS